MIYQLYAFLATTLNPYISPDDIKSVPQAPLQNGNISEVLKVVFGFAGGISLLIITIAGLKYTLANGDAQAISKAKDTILYAIIGLVISLLAFSIVSFVIGKVQ